jgi:programmed cell death protein 4
MKVAVDQLLQEYLISDDLVEASRCLQELSATFFYHEIVKRSVVHALDKLLHYLMERDLLTERQAVQGFNRLYALSKDLALDSPTAAKVIDDFAARAIEDSVLPAGYTSPATPVVAEA